MQPWKFHHLLLLASECKLLLASECKLGEPWQRLSLSDDITGFEGRNKFTLISGREWVAPSVIERFCRKR